MPFMKGYLPVRRTWDYLNKSNLVLKPYIRILAIHYNKKEQNHQGIREFVIWHLPHLQYKNPDVQVLTIKGLTPTPFLRIWLNSGKDLVLDVDRETKDQIHERVQRTLCKTEQELKEEEETSRTIENPANFGTGCPRHCMCELPGQIPCPLIVPLPYTWRGKYKWGSAELDESKYV